MEGRLYRWQGRAENFGCLGQRVFQHVHQNHGRALDHRQLHDRCEARRGRHPRVGGGGLVGRPVESSSRNTSACLLRRRRASSAVLWAMANSRPFGVVDSASRLAAPLPLSRGPPARVLRRRTPSPPCGHSIDVAAARTSVISRLTAIPFHKIACHSCTSRPDSEPAPWSRRSGPAKGYGAGENFLQRTLFCPPAASRTR